MQTATFCGVQCSACPRSFRQHRTSRRFQQLVYRSALRRQARVVAPSTVSSALPLELGSGSNVQALTNILSAVIVGAGAWYYYRTQNFDKDGRQVCPRCHGTGVVECFCQRWSDNDVGCGTCGGSGKMVCNSCNGGGTAVPIEAKVHIEPRKKINDSYYPTRICSCRRCTCSKHSKPIAGTVSTHCAGC